MTTVEPKDSLSDRVGMLGFSIATASGLGILVLGLVFGVAAGIAGHWSPVAKLLGLIDIGIGGLGVVMFDGALMCGRRGQDDAPAE